MKPPRKHRERPPPTIDSGDRLPLEFVLHPLRTYVLFVLLLVPALIVSIDAHRTGSQEPLATWQYAVVELAIAAFGLITALECFQHVGWRIDVAEVRRWGWSLFGSRSWNVARADYSDLVTQDTTQPGFLGPKKRYQIFLFHSHDRGMDLVLYAGPDEETYRSRLAAYQALLCLPVNRIHCPFGEEPDWVAAAANYDVWR